MDELVIAASSLDEPPPCLAGQPEGRKMILMISKDIMIIIMVIRISMNHLRAWLVNQDDDVDDLDDFKNVRTLS